MSLLGGWPRAVLPVLVMHGDADPATRSRTPRDRRRAAATVGAVQRFTNVSHGAWRDQFDAALAVLVAFHPGSLNAVPPTGHRPRWPC